MQFLLFLTLSFIVSTCLGDTTGSKFKFDWGNSKVLVKETVTKKNIATEIQYLLTSKKQDTGVIVSQSDLKILSVNSQKPDNSLINVLEASFSIPDMKIDSEGNLKEVINFDLYINRLANSVPDPSYGKIINTEQMKNILMAKSVENWCYWVCMWVDLDASSGRSHKEQTTIELNGFKLPQLLEYNFVPNYEKSNRTLIRLNSFIGGEQAAKSLTGSTKNMMDRYGKGKKSEKSEVIDNFQRNGEITAIVDPLSLKPYSVEAKLTATVTSSSETKEHFEKKVFLFQWQ